MLGMNKKQDIDNLLIYIQMPKINGYEIIIQIIHLNKM